MQCQIFKDQETNDGITQNSQNRYYIDYYYPWHTYKGTSLFYPFSGLILDVKQQKEKGIDHFERELKKMLAQNKKYVVCIIPTHEKGNKPSGTKCIAKRLCNSHIIDGTDVLQRTKYVPPKKDGGTRNIEQEIYSLKVINEHIIKDQQVLLLDDVSTSGTSLNAGRHLLSSNGAKLVVKFSLGLTYDGLYKYPW